MLHLMGSLPALKHLVCMLGVLLLTLAVLDCATLPPAATKPQREKYPHAASVNLAAATGAFNARLNLWVYDYTLMKVLDSGKSSSSATYDTVASLDYSGVPDGQEYTYHVYEHSIPPGDTKCSSAGKIWSPTTPAAKACDPKKPAETCRAGDLSGKYGKLKPFKAQQHVSFKDHSLKLSYSQRGLLDRSVVVFNKANVAVACGNIVAHT